MISKYLKSIKVEKEIYEIFKKLENLKVDKLIYYNKFLEPLVDKNYLHKIGSYCIPKIFFLERYQTSLKNFKRKDFMLIDKNSDTITKLDKRDVAIIQNKDNLDNNFNILLGYPYKNPRTEKERLFFDLYHSKLYYTKGEEPKISLRWVFEVPKLYDVIVSQDFTKYNNFKNVLSLKEFMSKSFLRTSKVIYIDLKLIPKELLWKCHNLKFKILLLKGSNISNKVNLYTPLGFMLNNLYNESKTLKYIKENIIVNK
jgi:hypothetical protein